MWGLFNNVCMEIGGRKRNIGYIYKEGNKLYICVRRKIRYLYIFVFLVWLRRRRINLENEGLTGIVV